MSFRKDNPHQPLSIGARSRKDVELFTQNSRPPDPCAGEDVQPVLPPCHSPPLPVGATETLAIRCTCAGSAGRGNQKQVPSTIFQHYHISVFLSYHTSLFLSLPLSPRPGRSTVYCERTNTRRSFSAARLKATTRTSSPRTRRSKTRAARRAASTRPVCCLASLTVTADRPARRSSASG